MHARTMQIQHSLSDSQRLRSINRKFRRAQVSMKCDDGFVLEWRPLLADLEPSAICDQDVFRLQLDVHFIKHQRAPWAPRNSKLQTKYWWRKKSFMFLYYVRSYKFCTQKLHIAQEKVIFGPWMRSIFSTGVLVSSRMVWPLVMTANVPFSGGDWPPHVNLDDHTSM